MQQVYIVPHDPAWAGEFVRESQHVRAACGEVVAEIHHIGSTAVPGIRAKPIIDMLVVTDNLAALDEKSERLRELGYEALGEFGMPGRRYFRKNNAEGVRTHQIHAFFRGSPQIERHLLFCDYLRAHAEVAAAYDELKARLAAMHPRDIGRYTDGKDEFIRDVDARAALWGATVRSR